MADIDIFNFSGTSDSSMPSLSKDEFVADIVPKVQAILDKIFPNNKPKRRIKVYKDRISFAAPCCGDSASNNYKKRGNIIIEGKFRNMYKCFNCGTFMSLPDFFKRYGQELSLSEIDYISKNKVDIQSYSAATNDSMISYIYDTENIDSFSIDREWFKQLFGLCEITEDPFIRSYIFGRRQYDTRKFLYSVSTRKLFILNLTPNNRIIGFQVRNFSGDSKYKTYNLQKIHNDILCDGVSIPDDINTLSMLFNVMLVDCNRVVTVVEGPMDSFLLNNSIALCGAAKNMEFPFMVRFLFDDDKAGRQHAIEKIKEGYEVFLWDVLKKDLGLESKKKWDVNDLFIWCDTNNVKLPDFDKYYSGDELDLIAI